MKKFRLLLGLVVAVLLLSTVSTIPTSAQSTGPCPINGCPPCYPFAPTPCPTLTLTERNNGQSFVVGLGQQIIVQLPAKPNSSLSFNTAILRRIPTITVVIPGYQVWGLQAVGYGRTTVVRLPYNDFKVSITVALTY